MKTLFMFQAMHIFSKQVTPGPKTRPLHTLPAKPSFEVVIVTFIAWRKQSQKIA
jgi:hypothetical protein